MWRGGLPAGVLALCWRAVRHPDTPGHAGECAWWRRYGVGLTRHCVDTGRFVDAGHAPCEAEKAGGGEAAPRGAPVPTTPHRRVEGPRRHTVRPQ
jgi:hypothetical protein